MVGALAVDFELKFHYFLASFVALIGFVSFRRSYTKYNAFEHVLLMILFMAHMNISFSIFQAIKVFVSFIFFFVELVVLYPELQPSKRNINTTELSTTMFWSPRFGFSLVYTEEGLLQRLDTCCGKFYEWATVTVYLLSTHILLFFGIRTLDKLDLFRSVFDGIILSLFVHFVPRKGFYFA